VTVVTAEFARNANLVVSPDPRAEPVATAGGATFATVGYADVKLNIAVQLLAEDEDPSLPPQYVTWHREVTIRGARVVDFGPSAYDLYVAWEHWSFDFKSDTVSSPLGSLAKLILSGATVVDTPRAPPAGSKPVPVALVLPLPETLRVVSTEGGRGGGLAQSPTAVPAVSVSSITTTESDIRERILSRVPEAKRGDPRTARLVDLLVKHAKVFSPLDPSECTEVVEFELIHEPERVGFRAPVSRKVIEAGDAAFASLHDWIRKGLVEKVDWATPSYGFVFVVPKANGKFRVTISPLAVNAATKRIDPEGGFMPDSMIGEVMSIGRQEFAAQLDLAEAFVTLKLGPTAQRVSTFVTPLGKLQWKHGWFGWHSFPAYFQRLIMEKVVLPTLDDFPKHAAAILAWIDDILLATRDFETFLRALELIIIRILAFGGRLSLAKCHLLVDRFDWCGVEVDITTNLWRIARHRVADFTTIPSPRDRTALVHVLGILRYYYFGVSNQRNQRRRITKLAELDVPGIRLLDAWTEDHERAMRGALDAVANGDWVLLYDPRQPVVVTTDASGDHGFGITSHQYAPDGRLRPIFFYSRGWVSSQTVWSAQVKECYAQWAAITQFMPTTFKYADVILVGDNRNLTADTQSADLRIRRWTEAIRSAGVTKVWTPGEYNTIADYASRVAHADPDAELSAAQKFEAYVYGLSAVTRSAIRAAAANGPPPPARAGAAEPSPPVREQSSNPPASETRGSVQRGRKGVAMESPPTAPPPPVEPLDDEIVVAVDGAVDRDVAVPGHIRITSRLGRIARAQALAGEAERASWVGSPQHSTVFIGSDLLHLDGNRTIVPEGATDLKTELLTLAHTSLNHYTGAERTLWTLREQCRITWKGISDDVSDFVRRGVRCAMAKPRRHGKSNEGLLHPTLAPYVHHTWYADLKGPLPHDTGYILAIRESISRVVKLRYLPKANATEVIEELDEAAISFGTLPVVLRTDGGPPFNSAAFAAHCEANSVKHVVGVPYHSQGQGKIETLFRSLSAAIVATLGHKAPREWFKPPLLGRLEWIINTSVVDPLRGSPMRNLLGYEPRTPLSASLNWEEALGYDPRGADTARFGNDVNEILSAHHSTLDAVQDIATQATCLEQAFTKRTYDASHVPSSFKAGDTVLLHVVPANRLLPYFSGPYRLTRVLDDGNVAYGTWLTAPALPEEGPFHVSRLLHFEFQLSTRELKDVALFHAESGSGVVDKVINHRVADNGAYELEVVWVSATPVHTWTPLDNLRQVAVVKEYCEQHKIKIEENPPSHAKAPRASRRK
jgi:hypothetical protein